MAHVSRRAVANSNDARIRVIQLHSRPRKPSNRRRFAQVVPDGFRRLLVWLKDEYGNPPLMVTENGYGDAGQSDDADRIDYIRVRA